MTTEVTQKDISLKDVCYVDANSVKYWVVLLLCIAVGYGYYGSISLTMFLMFTSSIFLDWLLYFKNIIYYDPSLAIARGYSLSSFCNDTLHSQGIDYGFNFYDGDYDKNPSTAQVDKFKYAIKTIGIRKGDRVIDIGCGCGDWLHYLQTEMKCTVSGVNITAAQAVECHKRGLNVHITDWKLIEKREDLKRLLYGQFDVVTCWDTVEHYVSMGEGLGKRKNRAKIYQSLFRLVSNLLDPKSDLSRCWISCLHMRREVFKRYWTEPRKGFYCYLLDKFHSGFYPSYYTEDGVFHDELADNAKHVGFDVTWRKDVTTDYYMTSILNATHFGRHRFTLTLERLGVLAVVSLLDPYWVHRILWFTQESWMIQFDPKDIDNSDVILWWLVFNRPKQSQS
eukprot:47380_1